MKIGEPFEEASAMRYLSDLDPEIFGAIQSESTRQQDGLEMIASENYTSFAVMQAVGSILTNKYAEGYPGRRYYGGCEFVDVVEQLAIDRAKESNSFLMESIRFIFGSTSTRSPGWRGSIGPS